MSDPTCDVCGGPLIHDGVALNHTEPRFYGHVARNQAASDRAREALRAARDRAAARRLLEALDGKGTADA